MRRMGILVLMAGLLVGSYATDARIISMGKHDGFFMDEHRIFTNPAVVSLYPNMLYGSLGNLKNSDSSLILHDPFFGAIVSYSLNENVESKGKYPMLSVGAFFNRYDNILDYVTVGKEKYLDTTARIEPPVGKVDAVLGYVNQNGVMMGVGAYLAVQSKSIGEARYETKIIKGNVGLNWPVAKTMDLEISGSAGTMTVVSDNKDIAKNDYFGTGEVRLFSGLAGMNGDFVPKIRVDFLRLKERKELKLDILGGLGLNIKIDRGFFWAGGEFIYAQRDAENEEALQNVGGRVSFGIERNVIWDWFVIRTGCQKIILMRNIGTDHKDIIENPVFDETANDLIGFGFGINIENRLRIDFVANELTPYTFTDLISNGNQRYLFNKMSVTYSF